MLQLRKRGLNLSAKAALRTSETRDGLWVAWLEIRGEPLQNESGRPILFEGPTRYQAQCKAYRWYSPDVRL